MLDKPLFFAQETEFSCAVACLRMVLSVYDIAQNEKELCALCDCTWEGTEVTHVVRAARKLGFTGTGKHNLSFGELVGELHRGRFPIVYVRTHLGEMPIATQHAYVVIAIAQDHVTVLDPWQGERKLIIGEFEREWQQMRGLTILCEK